MDASILGESTVTGPTVGFLPVFILLVIQVTVTQTNKRPLLIAVYTADEGGLTVKKIVRLIFSLHMNSIERIRHSRRTTGTT